MRRKRQIIAMGGGGFSMEPKNPLLDRYILAQTGVAKPRICFVPTASGDARSYIRRFTRFFAKEACHPTHLSLFRAEVTDLCDFILSQDVIYVGGGNTRNMLVLWREWGIDEILREAWRQGVVLAGLSAGANCWFASCVTDSNLGGLSALPALGLLEGSFCPHYDSEASWRTSYHRLLRSGLIKPGWACDDGVALHYVDEGLHAIVSSREHAFAYQVGLVDGKVNESKVTPRYLGDQNEKTPLGAE
ncbi:Type 1 glutamine amidotransferase-like domain-containing protein [Laceyella putida]|uniref:Type 1 glutamine amidotransferase-like domain-containing protein n=1 Tax=Laceyella putida TaxID=110101 RepID=A0ABW2RIG8_9BACL